MKKCNIVLCNKDGWWCATFRDTQPKEGDFTVQTACNHVIVLPHGFKRGIPTCPDCLKNIKRRRCNQ